MSDTQIMNTSGSITAGHAVQFVNNLATAASSTGGQPFHGVALQNSTADQSNIIQTSGLLSKNIVNLGAGVACAVGLNSSGGLVRAADVSCVSAPNWIGYCDTNGIVTVAPRKATNFNVSDFGATLDNVTDDTSSIQAAINKAASVGGGTIVFPDSASVKISKLTIGYHNISILGNNTSINTTATDGYVIDAAPISGTIYPNNIVISDLGIVLAGSGGTTGIRWRFTHSEGRNIQIALQHVGQVGFELAGDPNGTGPYYNKFYGCNVQGNSDITQTGWNFTHSGITPTRSPNANQFFGGRVGQVGLGWHIEGDRNAIFAPITEGIVASGTAFDINHISSSIDCAQNQIYSGYHEQNNEAGTTIYKIGANSSGTLIHGPFFTGISPGVTISDSGIDSVIVSQGNTQFNSNGFTIVQDSSVNVSQIKGPVPAFKFNETANGYIVTAANEGGSNAGDFAFTVRDNITASRLVAAMGTVTAQLRATQLTMGIGSFTGLGVYVGTSSPNGSVSAPVGSIYLANGGGAGTSLWVKESGAGNTGWVAK